MSPYTELLRQLFFQETDAQVIERLVQVAVVRDLAPGQVVLEEGATGQEMYFVVEGGVEVIKGQGDDQMLLARRGPGELFGEMGFIEDRPRFATVRAIEPTRLLELSEPTMRAALAQQPLLLYQLVRMLSARLRASELQMIADLQRKNQELTQAYHQLKQAHEAIVEKERLERELQVARRIQESILPRKLPSLPGFNFGARMIPARAVGGDLYDFIPFENDKLGVVIGDVSDKGVPAAIFMALTRSLLRAEAHISSSPGQVLRNVNCHLLDMNTAGMFVTLLYGILDQASGEFAYARAGHCAPWIFDAHGQMSQPDLRTGQLIGLLPDPALDEQTIAVPHGGAVLLFTDGATDASDAQRVLFGEERLEQAARASLNSSAQEMCNRVWESIKLYQGESYQADDVTLVAIHAND